MRPAIQTEKTQENRESQRDALHLIQGTDRSYLDLMQDQSLEGP